MSFLPDFCRLFFFFFFRDVARLFTLRVRRQLLSFRQPLTFRAELRPAAADVAVAPRLASPPFPTATRPPQILNKPRETIQIWPVIDTIRRTMSRICRRGFGTTKPACHLAVKRLLCCPPGRLRGTLLISARCILTLTVLNRSRGSRGQSRRFCALKCG